ncbi:GNAT family N-acetyltransferase [Aliivibrio sifiae]|uniref:N-acetyltransferase n=1 Tax=Aliivibrio sifiae TaxID=566293 RepID=A0A2S7X8L9_9GAMM|nr:GNAT family protein [Aliivibrio sifiae]PQJ87486.1 GNAT family N-acetyltransferase [Aliivibrio sifiae]GLR77151.1 N-acetyltransferase [Aliivibrio sifiae]
MFKIDTDNLILRDMMPEDEAYFVAMSQDTKYQRFYNESDCDPDKYKKLTKLFIEQSNESPRHSFQLAIEDKNSGEFIGTVCLRLESDFQASIGCGLLKKRQGSGLMQEAAIALADFGFRELNVHRLYAETISKNAAAIKLCESLGMQKEGHFREHRFFKNQWWDTVVFSVLHTEWVKA